VRSGFAVSADLRFEHRLVKAGRQRVDQVDVARKLAVLLAGDRPPDTKIPRCPTVSWIE